MTTAQKKLTKLIDECVAMRARFAKDGKSLLSEIFKDFFAKHPEVAYLRWTQYSPHFNDGDACTFYVHDIEHLSFRGEDEDDDVEIYDLTDKQLEKDIDAISGAITDRAMRDVMEQIFGNHVQVTAKPSGFTTSEYDHD